MGESCYPQEFIIQRADRSIHDSMKRYTKESVDGKQGVGMSLLWILGKHSLILTSAWLCNSDRFSMNEGNQHLNCIFGGDFLEFF